MCDFRIIFSRGVKRTCQEEWNRLSEYYVYVTTPYKLFFLCMLLLFLCPTVYANAEVTKTKVKLAIVDTRSPSNYVRSMFESLGVTVEWIDSTNVNPKDYDGLLISGGADITPELYGSKNTHSVKCNLKRDKLQCVVILLFAMAGKPVFGICGGEQHINVAFGGTMKQHIKGRHSGYRNIIVQKGSFLYSKLKSIKNVYHSHHQTIKKLGKGLVATQWDEADGTIEAIAHEILPVYGVQYHPERMDEKTRKIVASWFLSVCRKCKNSPISVDKETRKYLKNERKRIQEFNLG